MPPPDENIGNPQEQAHGLSRVSAQGGRHSTHGESSHMPMIDVLDLVDWGWWCGWSSPPSSSVNSDGPRAMRKRQLGHPEEDSHVAVR
jgi:hypothetical protein